MSVDNKHPELDAVAEPGAEVVEEVDADTTAEEDADQVEHATQGLITIGLFLAFVTFALFCLPLYFF